MFVCVYVVYNMSTCSLLQDMLAEMDKICVVWESSALVHVIKRLYVVKNKEATEVDEGANIKSIHVV